MLEVVQFDRNITAETINRKIIFLFIIKEHYIFRAPDFLNFVIFLRFSLHFLLLRGVKSEANNPTATNNNMASVFFISFQCCMYATNIQKIIKKISNNHE